MKKTLLAIIAAVLGVAIYAWAQYTPITREDAAFGSGLTASTVTATTSVSTAVMYDGAADATVPWYLAPSYFRPASYSVWEDDFYTAGYLAGAAANLSVTSAAVIVQGPKFSEVADHTEWLVSVTDGGGDDGETIVVADDGGSGWLQITANNAADDDVEIQRNGEAFAITTSRDLWYETRLEVEDVSSNVVFAGLTVADTDILGSLGNDFMGFYLSNSTNVSFQMAKNGTIVTNAAITQLVDATATVGASAKRLAFYADGSASNVYVYVDGTAVATNSASASLPNDEALSPAFATRTSDTGADYLRVDYLKIIQTR